MFPVLDSIDYPHVDDKAFMVGWTFRPFGDDVFLDALGGVARTHYVAAGALTESDTIFGPSGIEGIFNQWERIEERALRPTLECRAFVEAGGVVVLGTTLSWSTNGSRSFWGMAIALQAGLDL